MSTAFVHLRVHSEYSVVDGVVRLAPLVGRVAELGMPAVGLSDHCNLFGMVKFYRAAQQRGVKPIIGADLWLAPGGRARAPGRLSLFCRDAEGYRNLSALLSRAYTEGQRDGLPEVCAEWVREYAAGLIALSGAREGDVGQALLAGQTGEARRLARHWAGVFPDAYYLELQRTGRDQEERYLSAAVELAAELELPVVATNDVRFLGQDDFEAHEARVCIHQGRTLADPRRPRAYTAEQYLRSPREMQALFADLPEALANSVHIAERCNLALDLGRYHLPRYPLAAGESVEGRLREQAEAGLEQRLQQLIGAPATRDAGAVEPYRQRLERELGVIETMGFAGYFLIVADFIGWARSRSIPVGPGRGSGAGSLVAYSLGITDLDPLAYDLLFERFLNPERVSMPDFDVDFCMDRRDEVIDYVVERYGREKVAQIITHGTMAAKAVVRDVGRVLGFPYGFVDQIAKLIPFELNVTLDQALQDPALKRRFEEEEDVRTVIELARKLEGLVRNAGRHAGGVVIAPEALTRFMPLYCEQGAATPVTQLDMGDVEGMGLVKFDFLGLRTLTIIDWAIATINRRGGDGSGQPVDIASLPLDDAATFELIRRAETTAVFQLESRGMKELIKRLRPDRFEDLIALVALFRPGPLQSGMVDDFIDRKHGRAKVEYPHPALESILQPTYGVIVYQEQVMQIAQSLAGYTLGAADMLRRAMGKKKPEEMAKQRDVFLEGAKANGVEASVAEYIFDLMEKFAGYGFNKSHSAAYALVAYQTAWLKAHYPAAFMAAVLSADMDNTDKVVGLIEACRGMGLTVCPPALNACEHDFLVADEQTLRYGLGAIKGVGEGVIEAVVSERKAGGPYSDLFELCRRLDQKRLNRRVLEALVRAGALDGLGPGRASLAASLERAVALAEQSARARSAGQHDMFGLALAEGPGEAGDGEPGAASAFVEVPEWPDRIRLAGEKETLGLYLTGHPIERYEPELPRLAGLRLAELKPGRRRVAGLVVGIRVLNGRRGRVAFVTLDDRTARIEVAVQGELLEHRGELLTQDRVVVVEGQCNLDDYSGGFAINAERLMSVEQARESAGAAVCLRLGRAEAGNGTLQSLQDILAAHRPGKCAVHVHYRRPDAQARLCLGDAWRVQASDSLLDALMERFGAERAALEYPAQT